MIQNPLIVAIDKHDFIEAIGLVSSVKDYCAMVKLGLEFFVANGMQGVNKIAEIGVKVFLDLKLHDIPNTVASAVGSCAKYGHEDIKLLTIHASGGAEMMKSAVLARNAVLGGNQLKLIGVTALTSDGNANAQHVLDLAMTCKEAGMDGIVCSGMESMTVKTGLIQAFGSNAMKDFEIIVPGIRPKSYNTADDQARIVTPSVAMQNGATFIVVGRPISQSRNPAVAAKEISDEICAMR